MEDNKKPKRVKKEPKQEVPKDDRFSKHNHDRIKRFVSMTSPSKDDMDEIFGLYNEYVGPKFHNYSTNCNCSHSIVTIYWNLMSWFQNNKEKFATE